MDTVSLVGIVATAWWALAVTARAAAVGATFIQPVIRSRLAVRGDQPAVSVVIPVVRMEPEVDAAFASVFSQAYPQFEVLITAAETDSDVIDTARRVAARYPHVLARFLLSNQRFTLNPKVSNLAPAIAAAAHDLILIKDANIWLAEGQLAELVRNLTPGTGMVCAVPIGVRPESFSAEIECAIMNAHAAPYLMGASVLGLDVGFGKVMLFDRPNFNRGDGIAVMAPTFGDDHALAKALARMGLRTVFSAGVIRQAMGRRTLREVWDRQLRWMVIRREEHAFSFIGEPFFSALFATLSGALAAPALGTAWWAVGAATLAFWLASDALVVLGRGWGWSWRFPLAGLCREALIIGLWLRAWASREVRWTGRPFDLKGEPPPTATAAGVPNGAAERSTRG
jgi:ceramide glucosyltransferase